ncbi:MAG: GldG family protein [Deltaproteobacteria bacterium]|nr:GldG family protein [Deltaproteobacteria bacterium]
MGAGVVTRGTKISSAIGVLAAVAIVVLVNLLAARHYRRFDATTAQLYTLSPATLATLRELQQPIQIEILLSANDPLAGTVGSILAEYKGHAPRIEIHQVDPDRHPAEFVAIQQKYGILAGKTEDGRVVTDASVIVAAGDRHWFIATSDMVDLTEAAEGKSRSKIEQALTGAIRAVVGGERIKVCASSGHGESSLDDNGPQGLGELRDRLNKNNFEPVTVDSTRPDAREPFKDCRLLIVAGPSQPFSQGEADEIASRMRTGMSGLLLLNPMFDSNRKKQVETGLESVTKLFGIGLAADFVFETDDRYRLPRGVGEAFFPDAKPHPITDAMVNPGSSGLRVMIMRSRSLTALPDGPRPTELLVTSNEAYGMKDFFAWADKGGEPTRKEGDRKGPLTVAMASELLKPGASQDARGARVVVLGSPNVAYGLNWEQGQLRGNAIFMENAVSWLVSRQPILDIPTRVTPAASLRITEGMLGEIMRYVLVFMPGAALLLGVSVYLLRRSDKKDAKKKDKAKGARKIEP